MYIGFGVKSWEELHEECQKHTSNLLKDEDVCKLIIKNWFHAFSDGIKVINFSFDEEFYIEDVMDRIRADQTLSKEVGAVNIWREFAAYSIKEKEYLIYCFIKSFCGLKTSDGHIFFNLKNYKKDPEKLEDKAVKTAATFLVGKLLDVKGLGLLLKLGGLAEGAMMEAKLEKYQANPDFNPFDKVLEEEKYLRLKNLMIRRITNKNSMVSTKKRGT